MRVRYTKASITDLASIGAYLREHNPTAARTIAEAIEQRVAGLADFPVKGPAIKRFGVRQLSVVPYPYRVYYRLRPEEILVLRIRHARRKPLWGAQR